VAKRTSGRWKLPVVSVRVRLMAVITAAAILGLAGVGATVYIAERQRILDATDKLLRTNLESAQVLVTSLLEDDPGATAEEALEAVVQRVSPDDNMGVLGIIDGVPTWTPGVELDVPLQSRPDFVEHVVERSQGSEAFLGRYAEDGVLWQYLVTPIVLSDAQDQEVLFVIAYDLEAELREINGPGQAYLVASGVMIVLIIVVGAFAAGRLLRPLRQMRETAERVSGQDLEERLPVEGRDDVSELARTMNDMLDRIDASLGAQRQLVSDVRHELRTPITIVRGHLELMDPEDPQDVRETQALTVDELDRMNALVQNLSEATALEGSTTLDRRPTDLPDLMDQIVRKAQAIEGADVERGGVVSLVVDLDPARITQAMLQLAQNGVTHGGGRLVIGCHVAGSRLEFWVRDSGEGVPDDHKRAVFERFHRGSARAGGSGLGLNIVEAIAEAHGGSARVIDAADGPGAVFIVALPLPDDVAAAAVSFSPADAPQVPRIPPRPPLPGPASHTSKGDARGIDSDR